MRGRRRLARAAGWLSLAATVFAGGALAAPSSTAVAPVRVALVVGHNAPIDASTEPLRYADDDAVAWQRLLTEAGVEARLLTVLDEETRTLHPDLDAEPPTLAAVELALRGLFAELATARSRGARTELTLIYSGHGEVAGGEGVVALQGGRLTRTHLRQLLAESPADHNHVVIDACKSYFMAFAKGPGGERVALEPGALAAVDLDRSRTGFLLSTSSDRASHEWERFRAGIFSHQLRSALRGAADADVDGRLTYAEVGAFLSSANAGIDNARYRPDFLVAPPAEAPATRAELLRWADAPGLVADDFA